VATAGVRGAKQDEKKIEWMYMDEDAQEQPSPLQQGELLLQAGKYTEAIALFGDLAAKGVAPEEEPYLHYFLAYANAAKQEQIAALKEIDKVQVKANHPLYDAVLLLKGQMLISTLAFKEALAMFNTYLHANASGETAQSMLILSSYCYKGLNNTGEQKKSLAQAEKLAPDSPLGQEARRLLDSMKS
jgi:tetratricopeptide (TPR) repeat protein